MKAYQPLIVVIIVALSASLALQADVGAWDLVAWMRDFMGVFLVIFSLFKLLDVPGFVEGFSKYDILARRFRAYGFAYPFIELVLGLSYLAGFFRYATDFVTAAFMIFGSIGVVKSLSRGLDVNCACLGTILRVPLSTIAVFEDIGMASMALAMFFLH
jgi:hypothetical protein